MKKESNIRQSQLTIYAAQQQLTSLIGELEGLQQVFARAADLLTKAEEERKRGCSSGKCAKSQILEYAFPSASWALTEKKARFVLESNQETQIVGLVIRNMNTGQTTVIDQSFVRIMHPDKWNEVLRPKQSNQTTK